ncbi:HNH endonuclease [Streptomyces sp. NPDC090085]|uniref:HNH endonuclease n=1 Tax=unclassified Streptomyces TaxID=2593676 RepID=UPI0037D74781
MSLPSWEDKKLGTMKRAALWLVAVVGEGNTFTKEEVKQAFPGVSQADRRVRDLRDFGWRIDTNREDLTLSQHEQRFVFPGEPVWEPGKGTRPATSITDTQRREILARDGHHCRSCGITAGETYPGTYVSAQLDIARRPVTRQDGTSHVENVAECNRCRVGGRGLTADLAGVLGRLERLGGMDRKTLADWVAADAREFAEVERIWADFRTLPADARNAVREALSLPPA